MSEMQFIVPTLFGLEGLAGDELRRMNMENVRVEDRRVLFTGDENALAKANICWHSSRPRALKSCSRGYITLIWSVTSPKTDSSR